MQLCPSTSAVVSHALVSHAVVSLAQSHGLPPAASLLLRTADANAAPVAFGLLPNPVIFGVGMLIGVVIVLAARGWLRLRGRQRSPQAAPASTQEARSAVLSDAALPDLGDLAIVRKLLAELEDLKVTLASGPPPLIERLMTLAQVELAADPGILLLLAGFGAAGDPDDRIARCGDLAAALDLITAGAVSARRELAGCSQRGDRGAGQRRPAEPCCSAASHRPPASSRCSLT